VLPWIDVQALSLLRLLMLQRLVYMPHGLLPGVLHVLLELWPWMLQVLQKLLCLMLQLWKEVLRMPHQMLLEDLFSLHQMLWMHFQVSALMLAEAQLLQHFLWPSLPQPSRLCMHLPTQALRPWLHLPLLLL
jgi:hypothetical protein